MIPTSHKSRARVAAEVYARDHPHLLDQTHCVVVTRNWKVDALLAVAGRRPTFETTTLGAPRYARMPLSIDPQNLWLINRLRQSAGNNKRLVALIALAVATNSQIRFGHHRGTDDAVSVDCDITCTDGRSPEALAAAASWMRIEHADAVGRLMRRAHGEDIDFRIDYPADAKACIVAVQQSFAAIADWVKGVVDTPEKPIPEGDDAVETLRALLDSIPAKRLNKSQADRLNRARAIVGRMAKAA